MKKNKLNLYEDDLNDLNALYICSVRYAIGRATYMPKLVQDFIRWHEDTLQLNTVCVIIRDIEMYVSDGNSLGMDCDRNDWMHFYEWLNEKKTQMEAEETP